MQSRKKTLGRRKPIFKKKRPVYSDPKTKLVTPRSIQSKSDELLCHISLSDFVLYNNLTSKGYMLVNWAGATAGADTTFRLVNSLEFTNNQARFRWYKVHSVTIELRATNMAYEFDTARTGGLTSLVLASSPVPTDVDSISTDAKLQQILDYKEVPAPKQIISKTVNLAKFFKNHFNINDRIPTSVAYPDMYTAARATGQLLGANGSTIATCKVQWAVSFYGRIPTVI